MRRVWPPILLLCSLAVLMCVVIFIAVHFAQAWALRPAPTAPRNELHWFDEALSIYGTPDESKCSAMIARARADPAHEQLIADRLPELLPDQVLHVAALLSDLAECEARDSYLPLIDYCVTSAPARWRGNAMFAYANYPWSKVGARVKSALNRYGADVEGAAMVVCTGAWRSYPEPEMREDAEAVLRGLFDAKEPATGLRAMYYGTQFGWVEAAEAELVLRALIGRRPELVDDWPSEYTRRWIEEQRARESSEAGG